MNGWAPGRGKPAGGVPAAGRTVVGPGLLESREVSTATVPLLAGVSRAVS
jgi:hypothetical protein